MLFAIEANGPKRITRVPHLGDHERFAQRLTRAEQANIESELAKHFDAREVTTSSFIPGHDWTGTAYEPIWRVCDQNEARAAAVFGLIVWEYIMDRREDCWSFGRYPVKGVDVRGMTYFRIDPPPGF